jgi:hypothetical protein
LITIVHGGQTGVDRGAHEAAIDNGWPITGYMPRDQRDELGRIPPDVARFLVPHDKTSYAARTAANVRASAAVLIVVRDADDPRATPGTAKTIDLAMDRHLLKMVVAPADDPALIARWIWYDLRMVSRTLPLPFETSTLAPIPTKLLVAGPRESKWQGARVETAGLLRRVALALTEISRTPEPGRDLTRAGR